MTSTDAARSRLGSVTFAAGSLVSVSGPRNLALPPGSWLAWEIVRENPNGGVWGEALGRLSEDVSAADPRWNRQRVCVATLPESPGGCLCEFVSGPEWGTVSPKNGPSFVGRLGGGGSHGPARLPQGDVLAFVAVMGRWPGIGGMEMEIALRRAALRQVMYRANEYGLEDRALFAGDLVPDPAGLLAAENALAPLGRRQEVVDKRLSVLQDALFGSLRPCSPPPKDGEWRRLSNENARLIDEIRRLRNVAHEAGSRGRLIEAAEPIRRAREALAAQYA